MFFDFARNRSSDSNIMSGDTVSWWTTPLFHGKGDAIFSLTLMVGERLLDVK